MYAATIVPEQFLSLTKDEKFHMALAHLIKRGNPYSKFFKEQSEKGIHILMDNGAAEAAQLPGIFDILKKAKIIGATEVVLPDEIMNKDLTLEKTERALKELKEANRLNEYLWMAVPQGRNIDHWRYCLRNLLEMDRKYDNPLNSIGISKFLSLNLDPMIRIPAVRIALKLFKEFDREDLDIHLLGCAYDINEIKQINKKFPNSIRSTDSAIAYVYAQKGLQLQSDINRPQFEIEFLGEHELNEDLLRTNIKIWKGLENIE